jgi:hypothetical protein
MSPLNPRWLWLRLLLVLAFLVLLAPAGHT